MYLFVCFLFVWFFSSRSHTWLALWLHGTTLVVWWSSLLILEEVELVVTMMLRERYGDRCVLELLKSRRCLLLICDVLK